MFLNDIVFCNNVIFLGKKEDVQAAVEKPSLYLLARCPSNEEQLFYSDPRLEDLKDLDTPIEFNGIAITDVMRLFKGSLISFTFLNF